MSSPGNHQQRAAQFTGAVPGKCFVCGDPIGEQCFCKIHRDSTGPIMLCCPYCTVQYLDAERPPADDREQELCAYENSVHLFVGEDKPWL